MSPPRSRRPRNQQGSSNSRPPASTPPPPPLPAVHVIPQPNAVHTRLAETTPSHEPPYSIVNQVLETLNNPAKSLPPPLSADALRDIYSRVKQKLAPNYPDDFEFLLILAPHLAKAIGESKARLLEAAKGQLRSSPPAAPQAPSQPPPPIPPRVPRESRADLLSLHMMQHPQTPVLNKFLPEIDRIIKARNDEELRSYLVIEPPFSDLYTTMIAEIRKIYPKGKEEALEERCSEELTGAGPDNEGSNWSAFNKFIANYFSFIRDVDSSNLLDTYNLLHGLQTRVNSALASASRGIIVLPTVLAYARVFARLAIGLDKNPKLIAHLVRQINAEEDGPKETLPERAANTLRKAFVTCLNDRGTTPSGINKDGKPDGKKVAIYKLANLCLKILFQCKKMMNGEQIFTNIYNQSPPLSIYPASERVTYLYYLGRFHFMTQHYYCSMLALQAAYDQCLARPECARQRRLILLYLIPSNMILGRFPTPILWNRHEAAGFEERFQPVIDAVIKGDLENFKRLLDWNSETGMWFFRRALNTPIDRMCTFILWRSLFRRAFIIAGNPGDTETRRAPTLDLNHALSLFLYLEKRSLHPAENLVKFGPAPDPPPSAYYMDKEYVGIEGCEPTVRLPTMLSIESKCCSLIYQRFMNGFISHRLLRFAIKGAKEMGGALPAGFPNVFAVIKAEQPDDCPGWKQNAAIGPAGGGFGPGMVINLSSARPVGSGPFG